jgi:rSAM/selenodomain-associated transferase 1
MQRHLVIMARQPRYGVGKRRLAREVGDLAAWRFQRNNLARLLRRVAGDPRWRTWLALTPAPGTGERRRWPPGVTLVRQGGGDLGARMARLLALPPAGPVVLIGADIPGIRASHIAEAFRTLGAHDWVYGPAADGGYWLVGARRRPVLWPPFDGVRWSTRHALADSLARCRGRVAFAATLRDVDTAADLAGAD